jgi:hypothetical protein
VQCGFNEELNGYYLESYPEVVCFRGAHWFHAFSSVFFSIAFIVISILVAINFFESRVSSDNIMARKNAHGEVFFIVNKIVLQLSISLLTNQAALVTLMFLGATCTLYFNVIDDPYYDQVMSSFFKTITLAYWWCFFMLFVLFLLKQTGFTGGMIVWMVGLPFVVVLGLSMSSQAEKPLTNNHLKFKDEDELMDHLRTLELLVKRQSSDDWSEFLLRGYIQRHIEACPEDDCPLRSISEHEQKSEDIEKTVARFLKVIERIYLSGLKKFKRSVLLRVSYAFFLMERFGLKKKALEQLLLAEKADPGFEEEFLIFRYKKIIEDNISDDGKAAEADNGSSNQVDIVGVIAFESNLRLCTFHIIQAAEFNERYWTELLKDDPSLERLSEIGTAIDFSIIKSNENWRELAQMIENAPVLIKLYSKFLTDVLNEQESAVQLRNEFERIVAKNLRIKQADFSEINELDSTLAVAVVGSKANSHPIVRKASETFCALFQLGNLEVTGKRYSMVFPDLYKNSSGGFIQSIFRNGHLKTGYFGVPKEYFAKTKAGVVFPIASVARVHSSSNVTFMDFLFINLIKPVDFQTVRAVLLTDRTGTILDINSFARLLFDSPPSALSPSKIKIQTIVSDVLVASKYKGEGADCRVTLNDERVLEAKCSVQSVLFSGDNLESDEQPSTTGNDKRLVGFAVAFTVHRFSEGSKVGKPSTEKGKKSIAKQSPSTSIYRFMDSKLLMEKNCAVGVCSNEENANDDSVKRSVRSASADERSDSQTPPPKETRLSPESAAPNPDRVITKRLQRGRIRDMADLKFYIEEDNQIRTREDVEFERSIFKDNVDKVELNRSKNKVIVRKNLLQKIMKKESTSVLGKFFGAFIVFWMVASLSLAVAILSMADSDAASFKKSVDRTIDAFKVVSIATEMSHTMYELLALEVEALHKGERPASGAERLAKALIELNDSLNKLTEVSSKLFTRYSNYTIGHIGQNSIRIPDLSGLPDFTKSKSTAHHSLTASDVAAQSVLGVLAQLHSMKHVLSPENVMAKAQEVDNSEVLARFALVEDHRWYTRKHLDLSLASTVG